MKAFILAAGFGTRLKPHSDQRPKPLFTIGGQTLLDRMIERLARAGIRAVAVNAHHRSEEMAAHIASRRHPVPVTLYPEPTLLGTGGGIRNIASWWGKGPLMVINADIDTDIDLSAVAAFHAGHGDPVTLVLVDRTALNSVRLGTDGRIAGFGAPAADGERLLTFTGIQVIEPVFLAFVPETGFSSSIDAYRAMLAEGLGLRAMVAGEAYWEDTGTPERYRQAVLHSLVPEAFSKGRAEAPTASTVEWEPLAGDGSDRRWFRLRHRAASRVLVDHGIHAGAAAGEAEAFVRIGRHLHRQGVPVPEILAWDTCAGLVIMEDLGDTHLQDRIRSTGAAEDRAAIYEGVIDMLVHMASAGAEGFDPSWTWQTPVYDRHLVIEKECRYFLEAFVAGVAGVAFDPEEFAGEFGELADIALENGVTGFLHRDFQSRNIMVSQGRFRPIDFQGGRIGPVQYDLASLVIDPYVALPQRLQERLSAYGIERICRRFGSDPSRTRLGFCGLSLARNLQVLGAFGHLSRSRGKPEFARYIPAALAQLKSGLGAFPARAFPRLRRLVSRVSVPGPGSI